MSSIPAKVRVSSHAKEFQCPVCMGVIDELNPPERWNPKDRHVFVEDDKGTRYQLLPELPKCPHCLTQLEITMVMDRILEDEQPVTCEESGDSLETKEREVAMHLLTMIRNANTAIERLQSAEAYKALVFAMEARRNCK